ncbi:hypothetical protein ACLOJK_003540 [Asimina triloba]
MASNGSGRSGDVTVFSGQPAVEAAMTRPSSSLPALATSGGSPRDHGSDSPPLPMAKNPNQASVHGALPLLPSTNRASQWPRSNPQPWQRVLPLQSDSSSQIQQIRQPPTSNRPSCTDHGVSSNPFRPTNCNKWQASFTR